MVGTVPVLIFNNSSTLIFDNGYNQREKSINKYNRKTTQGWSWSTANYSGKYGSGLNIEKSSDICLEHLWNTMRSEENDEENNIRSQ